MTQLRQIFVDLGFSQVVTYIASGNVTFNTSIMDTRRLETMDEEKLQATLEYDVPVFIRTREEWVQIVNYQPFSPPEIESSWSLNIFFLSDELDEHIRQEVVGLCMDTDLFHVHGREIYWLRRKNRAQLRITRYHWSGYCRGLLQSTACKQSKPWPSDLLFSAFKRLDEFQSRS